MLSYGDYGDYEGFVSWGDWFLASRNMHVLQHFAFPSSVETTYFDVL